MPYFGNEIIFRSVPTAYPSSKKAGCDQNEVKNRVYTLVEYTQAVIDDDWSALANDKLGQRTGALKSRLTEAVMNLEPATSIKKELLSFIVADLDVLSDHRLIRLKNAVEKPPVFVYVIIFGFLVTMLWGLSIAGSAYSARLTLP